MVTNDNSHLCHCGKSQQDFSNRKSFLRHRSSHEVVKVNCQICGQEFDSLIKLTNHKRVHKEIQCKECKKTFTRKDVFKKHEATHQDALVECSMCDKALRKPNCHLLLKAHPPTNLSDTSLDFASFLPYIEM